MLGRGIYCQLFFYRPATIQPLALAAAGAYSYGWPSRGRRWARHRLSGRACLIARGEARPMSARGRHLRKVLAGWRRAILRRWARRRATFLALRIRTVLLRRRSACAIYAADSGAILQRSAPVKIWSTTWRRRRAADIAAHFALRHFMTPPAGRAAAAIYSAARRAIRRL